MLFRSGVVIHDYKHCFIGENIGWDTVNPELIELETGVRLTSGVTILTHFIESSGGYSHGKVLFMKGCFVGTKSIITKTITLGEGSIIGAGSVVTKDVPDYEVWAGNPAHFIRKIKNIE